MNPAVAISLLLKLHELRGQIVEQKSKCRLLIERCQRLKAPLEKLKTSNAPFDVDLNKLEELLQKCVMVCEIFCGKGWFRSWFHVVINPTHFDDLHRELDVFFDALHLKISIENYSSQQDLMEIVTNLKEFIHVHGIEPQPSTLNEKSLQDLVRSSLEFSEIARAGDENRATMTLETLQLQSLSWNKDKLGKGGFGTVYRGRYHVSGKDQDVAVKVLPTVEEKEKSKLTREVRVMSKAQHVNVIKLFGYSIENGLIVMEIANCSLCDIISGKSTLSERYLQSVQDVKYCFRDVLRGLRYLHYHNIIHRDLKPKNILLVLGHNSTVVAKISDFGLATMATLSASATRDSPIGSVAYLAPELLEAPPKYSLMSDIYALGITFNEVLTRQTPYSRLAPNLICAQISRGNRPSLEWHPMYHRDSELTSLIGNQQEGCLHQNPNMRPSCDEMLQIISSEDSNQLDQMIYNSVEVMLLRPSDQIDNLASSGYPPAQNRLGVAAIRAGDFRKAVAYFRLAANQSYHPAEFNLGCCYEEGQGIEANQENANAYFHRSAKASFPPALYKLGLFYESHNDLQQANDYYRAGAQLNHAPCQSKLRDRTKKITGQPDFPYLVEIAVPPRHTQARDRETSSGREYSLVPSREVLGASLEMSSVEETKPPSGVAEYSYYFYNLAACFFFCCVSMILLILSGEEDWGEVKSRRLLSLPPATPGSGQPPRSLRVAKPETKQDERAPDAGELSTHPLKRNLASSISWPSYLAAPGETVVNLCGGQTLDVSMCSTSLDSNIACSGDLVLELLNPDGTVTIASDNDYCGLCPSLVHTVPSSTACSNYILRASCASGNCSGQGLLTVTTSVCSQAFSGSLSPSTNFFPVLSCSLLSINQEALSNLEGQWTVLHGGHVRDQCQLKGPGYGSSSYSSTWSSTAANRRFYFCTSEKDLPSVSLVAGSPGLTGASNGIGTAARFSTPSGVSVSSDGSYALVGEQSNNMIRKILLSNSAVSLLAGSGSSGTGNGFGTSARFNTPYGVSVSSDGSIALIVDTWNHWIRKIVIATAEVTTLAGFINSYYHGTENGIGTNVLFFNPQEVSLSSDGSFALVSDMQNNMIRKIVISTAQVSFFAGAPDRTAGSSDGIGTNAQFHWPVGVSLSSDGSFAVVVESPANRVRKIVISTAQVSFLAGDGSTGYSNGIGTNARFYNPHGISLSSDGSYALISDTSNNMIRKMVISTAAVSLLAGSAGGIAGSSNGIGTNARFSGPFGISLASDDSFVLVADTSGSVIRKITLSTSTPLTGTGAPSFVPSAAPSLFPTVSFNPTGAPSRFPTIAPSSTPSSAPSLLPTSAPSLIPTGAPSLIPTGAPSFSPTGTPSRIPTISFNPTGAPSLTPTIAPSLIPTGAPSLTPTGTPSLTPTVSFRPTGAPTLTPTGFPTTVITSRAVFTSFLSGDTTETNSASLTFIVLALVLVVCRLIIAKPQLRHSSVKLFAAWWWVGYLWCCAISAVCALAAVANYAETLSEESQGRYSTGFYLCLVSIFTSIGALIATPELYFGLCGMN